MSDELKERYELFKEFEQYQEFKKNGIQMQNDKIYFDINKFIQGVNTRNLDKLSRKYTKEQIRRFQEDPQRYERQLREVSIYLYDSFQEYRNLINFYGYLLTYDYILIPDNVYDEKDKLIQKFYDNLHFLENYNIKSKLNVSTPVLVREDVFYAYERTDGKNFIWQQLPTNYCRLLGTDEYECLTFEFDFSYFTKRNVDINNFDTEFKQGFEKYKQDTTLYRWQKINPEKGICFKFDKTSLYVNPFFLGLYEEVLGISDYKDLQENSSRTNNFKLIHQKIPMHNSSKDFKQNQFLIDDETAKMFHNNVKANVGEGIGVATSPMELNGISLNEHKIEEDMVAKAQRNVFTSAGVSQMLFNSEGNIGLNRSIENSESIMFSLLRQYELWFKKRLKLFNKNRSSFNWNIIFPDLTVYNRKEKLQDFLKAAQFGFSKFFVAASLGLSQMQFISLNNIENQLDLVENMIPLQSSHTQSDEGGKPEISDSDKQDSGIITKDRQDNVGKS